MTDFIPGLDLNELFYHEIVAPLLKRNFPDLPYSTALLGWGSDVLGYDDTQSRDHNWGLRFQIFLSKEDFEQYSASINNALEEQLPVEFYGHPTAFEIVVPEEARGNVKSRKHNLDLETIEGFFTRYLGCDPDEEPAVADWLTFSEHKLLAVTSGRVFYDGLGELEPIRQKFRYYPKDIWLYILAAQWEKIFEEAAFVGRCGYIGDELGSRLIATRQVKNLMHLCFMMERKYAPYSKWFGTAFSRLDCAPRLSPIFDEVLQAGEWHQRQAHLGNAYEVVAQMHNALQLTIPLEEKASQYYDRPYLVLGDDRYVQELMKAVTSEEIKNLKHRLGSVNQFIDSDDQLNNLYLCKKLRELYV